MCVCVCACVCVCVSPLGWHLAVCNTNSDALRLRKLKLLHVDRVRPILVWVAETLLLGELFGAGGWSLGRNWCTVTEHIRGDGVQEMQGENRAASALQDSR